MSVCVSVSVCVCVCVYVYISIFQQTISCFHAPKAFYRSFYPALPSIYKTKKIPLSLVSVKTKVFRSK